MPDKASSDPSPNRHPIEIVTFCHLVGDDEIERERQRREEADRKRAAAPPLNPPPATIGALLAECEKQRGRIVAAMREGQARFYPGTDENFLAALKGEISGFAFKPLELLFDAAFALDLGDVPALPGEPQTGRDAIAALDALLAWCRSRMQPAPIRGKRIKEPSAEAIACYRLSIAISRTQAGLAEMLSRELGKPVDQPQVSRWLKQVRAWLKAGNVLPDLSEPGQPKLKKKQSMDPALIDQRIIGRPKPTRSDADSEAEIQRLIAEQQADVDGPEPFDDDD